MTPTTVAAFILLDPGFPRSICHCVTNIELSLGALLEREELAHVAFARDDLERLKTLSEREPSEIVAGGLHEFIDDVQVALIALSRQIAATFFASEEPRAL
jgi:uncharacterized alpha-E superfamily protein